MSEASSGAESSQGRVAPPRRAWIEEAVSWGLLVLTLAGSCGAWHWTLDLCSHFRWYYFVAAAVFGVLIWRKRRRAAMASLGVTLFWNGGLLAPYYLPSSQPAAAEGGVKVSLVSLNVYTANKDKRAVIDYLRQRSADLVVVMEVDERWERALAELHDLYPHQFIQSRPDNFGIGLLSRESLAESRSIDAGNTDVPTIVARVEREGRAFVIVATHPLPPVGASNTRERDAQLQAVADTVKASSLPCLVAGDLNATPWSSAFRDLTANSGLRDSALGRGVQGSWNAKS
ncbi:MAG: endonuclease/exonuclease/phosphatase family protein, partial [Candidatus Saccharimonas sp.]|nr:endonuclease/exonuclease/phosphatase family protein [Planctomycetaceae bacterium]